MSRCPQCGAAVSFAEEELHPVCSFCGTSFRRNSTGGSRRLSVPVQLGPAQLRQAVRDHLARSGLVPTGEPELVNFHLPFLLTADGDTSAAFRTHVPELAGFKLPASDWKVFDETAIAAGDVVVEPSLADERASDHAIVHYPLCRAAAPTGSEEQILWIDAAHGRVLAADRPSLAAAPGDLGMRILLASSAAFFAIWMLFPFPWSAVAAMAATPLLYRWNLRRLREAR